MPKRYEILKSLPATGPMYIPVSDGNKFYSDYTEGFVIRFFKEDGSDWVANIRCSATKTYDVFELAQSKNLIVIAGGYCYIIDPENTKPIAVFGTLYKSVIKSPENQYILYGNYELTIIEPNGEYWHEKSIALLEIKNLSIQDDVLNGLYHNYEWEPFSCNLITKEITVEDHPYIPITKPWWKFWQ